MTDLEHRFADLEDRVAAIESALSKPHKFDPLPDDSWGEPDCLCPGTWLSDHYPGMEGWDILKWGGFLYPVAPGCPRLAQHQDAAADGQ